VEAEKWHPGCNLFHYSGAAVYSVESASTPAVLVETRPDGSERRYNFTRGTDGRATASLEGTPLTWFLTAVNTNKTGFVKNPSLLDVMQEMDSAVSPLERFVNSYKFETAMLVVICVNMGLAAMDSDMSVKGYDNQVLEIVGFFFVGIYAFETLLILIAKGRSAFRNPWFVFDTVLVALGIGHALVRLYSSKMALDAPLHQSVLIFRSLRVLRLLRAFRAVPLLRTAWRLVIGLYHATGLMVSTLALLTMMLFIFAFIGLEVITKQHFEGEAANMVIQNNFSTFMVTMMSLMQFVTLDGVSIMYWPLLHEKPLLILYFIPLVFVVSITLMNLVTAVVVDGALALSQLDRNDKRDDPMATVHDNVPLFEELFRHLDVEGDGSRCTAVRGAVSPLRRRGRRDNHAGGDRSCQHCRAAGELPGNIPEFQAPKYCGYVGDLGRIQYWLRLAARIRGQFSGLLNIAVANRKEVPTELLLVVGFMRKARERSLFMESLLREIRSEQISLVRRGAFSAAGGPAATGM